MQYANGREAEVGDIIIQRDEHGIPYTGVVVRIRENTPPPVGLVCVPVSPHLESVRAAHECNHINDVLNPWPASKRPDRE